MPKQIRIEKILPSRQGLEVSSTGSSPILQSMVLARHRRPAYPAYLYNNPYTEDRSAEIELGETSDLFDVLTRTYLARNVKGRRPFNIKPGQPI